MTSQRDGYRNVGTQITSAAWDALIADAEAHGQSVTRRLNELLHAHFKIPLKEIPPLRPVGRKPKKK